MKDTFKEVKVSEYVKSQLLIIHFHMSTKL